MLWIHNEDINNDVNNIHTFNKLNTSYNNSKHTNTTNSNNTIFVLIIQNVMSYINNKKERN